MTPEQIKEAWEEVQLARDDGLPLWAATLEALLLDHATLEREHGSCGRGSR